LWEAAKKTYFISINFMENCCLSAIDFIKMIKETPVIADVFSFVIDPLDITHD
jgi:hypothetical protein